MTTNNLEILGPNKDLTNIDTEIKEAEEFLSEDQINIIRSIVTTTCSAEGEACTSKASDRVETDNSKWENLRPTLRSLGLVRETDVFASESKLNVSTEEDSDLDSLSDDDSEGHDDDEDEEDTHDDDNEDHDNDIDLESIEKRRKKFRRKLRRKRKAMLQQKMACATKSKSQEASTAPENAESIIIIEDEVKTIPKMDMSIIEDTKAVYEVKEAEKLASNELKSQNSDQQSASELSKSSEQSNLEKTTGDYLRKLSWMFPGC